MPASPRRAAFGARVRELRERHGWSQEDFGHRADLDRTYVSGIERGVRNPTLDVIYRVADALGVEAAEIFQRG